MTYVDLQWPPQFISWFKWTGIANLAVLDLSPVDCMGSKKRISYYTRHTMESLLLPGIMVLFAVIYIVGMWTLRRYFSNKQVTQPHSVARTVVVVEHIAAVSGKGERVKSTVEVIDARFRVQDGNSSHL